MAQNYNLTEVQTKEVATFLPEEMQDLLAESALMELREANKVPFTPVEDAEALDRLIFATRKKLNYLLSIDVTAQLREDLEKFAEVETEEGKSKRVALINSVNPALQDIIKIERLIAGAIKSYQSILTEALKNKRLLSGQMFGSRLAHSSQVSRMKRVRQISVTGNDLLKEFEEKKISPSDEMQPLFQPPPAPSQNVIELFPSDVKKEEVPSFEPYVDIPAFKAPAEAQVAKPDPVKELKSKLYCSSYYED